MKTLKQTFILLMSLWLVGCAGHQQIVADQLSQSAAVFVGKSADELLKAKGPPDVTAQLSSGEHLWTYRATKFGERKGVIITIGGPNQPHMPEYMSWRENTTFVIGPDGFVKSYKVSVE